MILPAFFGHKRSINLLPRDAFESSTLGVVLEWSLVFGKWAVILTQLVVMSAFLYRFTLDRNLTDLRKAIAKDVAIIKSYDQVERDFVLMQKQINSAKETMESQTLALSTLNQLGSITPNEVWYDRIVLTQSNLTLTAYAASLPAFGQFLTAIQNSTEFGGVRIGKIENSTSKGAQLQFDVAVTLANGKQESKK